MWAHLDKGHLGRTEWDEAVVDDRDGHSLRLREQPAPVGTDQLAQEVAAKV